MKILLVLTFICYSIKGFCQEENWILNVINKIAGKTWVETKRCENDSCFETGDVYHDFSEGYNIFNNHKDTLAIVHHTYKIRDVDGQQEWAYVSCSPLTLFYRSDKNKQNSFEVLLWGNERDLGQLALMSDTLYSLSISENGSNYKYFYKAIATPKEILRMNSR